MLYLRFTLAAPLQSWGEAAPWDHKSTALFPTRTGIIGLISGCLGYKRDDQRIQELNDNLGVAVRADDPGHVVMDFQCIRSNRDYLVNAEGKKRTPKASNSIIIKKWYLEDARFTVFLEGRREILQEVHNAMLDPHYLTFLGRKICVPSEPIIPEWVEARNIYEAIRIFTDSDRESINRSRVKVEIDSNVKTAGPFEQIYTRRDRMVNGCDRNYTLRNVTSYYIDV